MDLWAFIDRSEWVLLDNANDTKEDVGLHMRPQHSVSLLADILTEQSAGQAAVAHQ